VGIEVLDMLPAGEPTRCTVRHSWMARYPATTDEQRAVYDEIYSQVHAAVRDEDFAMLPQCGEGVRRGQHDHMIIGRNEIGVQHMIKTFAAELGVPLDRTLCRAVRRPAGPGSAGCRAIGRRPHLAGVARSGRRRPSAGVRRLLLSARGANAAVRDWGSNREHAESWPWERPTCMPG